MKRILAIDDSGTVRRFIEQSVQSLDMKFFGIANNKGLSQQISKSRPDLLILDADFPETDSFDLCAAIRTGAQAEFMPLQEVPIIMITDGEIDGIRERGMDVGVSEFITKPFHVEELQHMIKRTLTPEKLFHHLHVLAVDDSPTIRSIVRHSLRETGVQLTLASDGDEALEIIKQQPEQIDLILTDFEMPRMSGLELCSAARKVLSDHEVPIIFLTSVNEPQTILKTFAAGATDYLLKPFIKEELLARLNVHLHHRLQGKEKNLQRSFLEHKLLERTRAVVQTQEATIEVIASLVEHRDPETGNHILRTKGYVYLLGNHLLSHPKYLGQFDQDWLDNLTKSAPLHDIGKVAIPDHILLKPGKLTEEEFEVIKTHSAHGRDALLQAQKFLGDSNFLDIASDVAGAHHEKWDGTGYPDGLKGEAIPLVGRIMAIADVYDALISKRAYKEAMSHEKAMEIILEGRGKHFDPDLTDLFLEFESEICKIKDAHED